MELQDAITILNSRTVVSEPGKYTAKVTHVGLYLDRHIINLNVMTSYHQVEAVKAIQAGDLNKALNQSLTANARVGSNDFIPSKGEYVHINVDQITTKQGVEGLFITGINAMPVAKAATVDFGALIEEVVEETVTDKAAKADAAVK